MTIGVMPFAQPKRQRRLAIKCLVNETRALSRRMFEASISADYDYVECANNLLWLLERELLTPEQLSGLSQAAVPAQLQLISPASYAVDATGANPMQIAAMTVDLALGRIADAEQVQIVLSSLATPLALAPGLVRCATAGYCALLWWWHAERAQWFCLTIEAGDAEPQFFCVDAPPANSDELVGLVCARDWQRADECLPATLRQAKRSIVVSSEQFAARHMASYDSGIELDEKVYLLWCEIADQVLVEDSELSRRGAGQ